MKCLEAEVWFADDAPSDANNHRSTFRRQGIHKKNHHVTKRQKVTFPAEKKTISTIRVSVCFANVSLTLSRVTNREGLKVLIDDNSDQAKTMRRISYRSPNYICS